MSRLTDYIATFPQITQAELVCGMGDKYRGRVVHQLVRHQRGCPAGDRGPGSVCRCVPVITYHLQPLDPQLDQGEHHG